MLYFFQTSEKNSNDEVAKENAKVGKGRAKGEVQLKEKKLTQEKENQKEQIERPKVNESSPKETSNDKTKGKESQEETKPKDKMKTLELDLKVFKHVMLYST